MKIFKDVEHYNHFDKNGRVYCRRLNKIIDSLKDCYACPLVSGSLQGYGVECTWDDYQPLSPINVNNPKTELLRVSKLIDEGKLEKM